MMLIAPLFIIFSPAAMQPAPRNTHTYMHKKSGRHTRSAMQAIGETPDYICLLFRSRSLKAPSEGYRQEINPLPDEASERKPPSSSSCGL